MHKDDPAEGTSDDLRCEYDFSRGVRGKYVDKVVVKGNPSDKSDIGDDHRLMKKRIDRGDSTE